MCLDAFFARLVRQVYENVSTLTEWNVNTAQQDFTEMIYWRQRYSVVANLVNGVD